jgi:hypothetical protein
VSKCKGSPCCSRSSSYWLKMKTPDAPVVKRDEGCGRLAALRPRLLRCTQDNVLCKADPACVQASKKELKFFIFFLSCS